MHEHQNDRRIAATKAFIESLDQLQNILAQERQTPESESPLANTNLLEEAAADLDAFFSEQDIQAEEGLDEES
ncbi:MAG TPA: hypothetical protein V6C85_08955 [Allocoleopsis sp.]